MHIQTQGYPTPREVMEHLPSFQQNLGSRGLEDLNRGNIVGRAVLILLLSTLYLLSPCPPSFTEMLQTDKYVRGHSMLIRATMADLLSRTLCISPIPRATWKSSPSGQKRGEHLGLGKVGVSPVINGTMLLAFFSQCPLFFLQPSPSSGRQVSTSYESSIFLAPSSLWTWIYIIFPGV